MDILNLLRSDSNKEVIEAVERCDYMLLQSRKKAKDEEKVLNAMDLER